MSLIASVLGIGQRVIQDPALPTVVELLTELRQVEAARPKTPSPLTSSEPGIGLRKIVIPLRIVIAVRKRPWLIPVGIGAAVLLPMAIGYALANKR